MGNAKVLITGASGLIGSNLAERLLRENMEVIGIARSWRLEELGISPPSNRSYTRIQGDIRDQVFIENILQGYEPTHMVHLAAQPIVGDALKDSAQTFDINIRGTWLLLEAAKAYGKLKSIIIASSDKAYGSHEKLPYRENFELKAHYPYDISKQACEQLAMSYYHSYGLPISITRCGNTFGPYDLNLSRIFPGTILSCLQNEDIIIRSSGLNERCYVYSKDVAEAYLKMLMAPIGVIAGQAFNIGSSNAISVLNVARHIRDSIDGCTSNIVIQNCTTGEIEHQSLSSEKIEKLLGWRSSTPFMLAVSETIAWYQSALPAFTKAGMIHS